MLHSLCAQCSSYGDCVRLNLEDYHSVGVDQTLSTTAMPPTTMMAAPFPSEIGVADWSLSETSCVNSTDMKANVVSAK
jgi:hypothetical protein